MAGIETYDFQWPRSAKPPPQNSTYEPGEYGPDIVSYLPQEVQLNEGDEFELEIKYTNSKYPVTITWKKDGRVLKHKLDRARGGKSKLSIPYVDEEHEGKYRVIICDPYTGKRARSTCRVTVY